MSMTPQLSWISKWSLVSAHYKSPALLCLNWLFCATYKSFSISQYFYFSSLGQNYCCCSLLINVLLLWRDKMPQNAWQHTYLHLILPPFSKLWWFNMLFHNWIQCHSGVCVSGCLCVFASWRMQPHSECNVDSLVYFRIVSFYRNLRLKTNSCHWYVVFYHKYKRS